MLRVCEPGRTPLFVVAVGRLEIGRGGTGLLLADPEISRRHLMVEPVGGAVVVTDLGSTNGTTVDGVRLTVPRVLGPGHVLRFGRCTLELSSLPIARAGGGRTSAPGRLDSSGGLTGGPAAVIRSARGSCSASRVARRHDLRARTVARGVDMEFRVLGSIEACEEGRALALGGPASVVCWRCCWPMPAASCPSIVWSRRSGRATRRPEAALRTTRTYVSRLRRVIGDGHVVTREPGYLIDVAGADVDMVTFEELLTAARGMSGDARSGTGYDEALRVWRGPGVRGVRRRVVGAAGGVAVGGAAAGGDRGAHRRAVGPRPPRRSGTGPGAADGCATRIGSVARRS